METMSSGDNGSASPGITTAGSSQRRDPASGSRRISNIAAGASPLEALTWGTGNALDTLQLLRGYAESEATRAIDWYFQRKRSKALISQGLRFFAIAATAVGGLLPIALNIPFLAERLDPAGIPETTLLASLAIGLGASFVGLDSFFGFSSGWIRYVVTASQIRKALEEFRMDWAMLTAKTANPPSADDIELLILRIKEFRLGIEDLVLEETRAWAAEFANNLARLEKEVKSQFESERAQRAQNATPRAEPIKTGAMDITITNGRVLDAETFSVAVERPDGTVVSETAQATNKWSRIGCTPGQYRLSIEAVLAGKPVNHSEILTVPPGGTAKATVTLGT